MKGCSLDEFLNDLLTMGGPEEEFIYSGNNCGYFLEVKQDKKGLYFDVFCWDLDTNKVKECWKFYGKDFKECTEKFANAKIFDGKNLYDVQNDITVTFG